MTPGIHQISAADYHADPIPVGSLSNSIAQLLIDKSPYHARLQHPRLNPAYKPHNSGDFDLGTAAHAMLLEGDDSGLVLIEADNYRTKAAQEARDGAYAAGKTPVLERQYEAIQLMVSAANAFIVETEIADEWDNGKSEQTVIWKEGDSWCRARPDRLCETLIVDYKTTTDAAPHAFSRQIIRMGYHFQASFYQRGIRAVDGSTRPFLFLAQEVEAPYACSLHGVAPSLQELADMQVASAIRQWRECVATNDWPAYTTRVHYAEAPAWMIDRAMEDDE